MATKPKRWQSVLMRLLGGCGALSWLAQILWLTMVYFEAFFRSSVGKTIFPAPDPTIRPIPPPVDAAATAPFVVTPLWMALATVCTLVLFGFVVYLVFFRYIPEVEKTSEKVVQAVAAQATEHLIKPPKKASKRKRLEFTTQAAFVIKVLVTLLLGAVVFIAPQRTELLPYSVITTGSLAITCLGLFSFLAQYLLIRIFHNAKTSAVPCGFQRRDSI